MYSNVFLLYFGCLCAIHAYHAVFLFLLQGISLFYTYLWCCVPKFLLWDIFVPCNGVMLCSYSISGVALSSTHVYHPVFLFLLESMNLSVPKTSVMLGSVSIWGESLYLFTEPFHAEFIFHLGSISLFHRSVSSSAPVPSVFHKSVSTVAVFLIHLKYLCVPQKCIHYALFLFHLISVHLSVPNKRTKFRCSPCSM